MMTMQRVSLFLVCVCACLGAGPAAGRESPPVRRDGHARLESYLKTFQLSRYQYQEGGRYQNILGQIPEALALARQFRNRPAEAKILLTAGICECYSGHFPAALESLFQSRSLFEAIDDPEGECRSNLEIANIFFFRLADYPLAATYYQKVLDLRRRQGNALETARGLNNLAETYRVRGNLPKAVSLYLEALSVIPEQKHPATAAGISGNLSDVQLTLGNLEESRQLLNRALAIYQRDGWAGGVARTYSRLGWWYLAGSRYAEAERYLLDALALNRKLLERDRTAADLQNLGLLYMKTGRLTEADDCLREAESIWRQLQQTPGLVQIWLLQAELLMKRSRLLEAERLLLICENTATAKYLVTQEPAICQLLSRLYQLLGDAGRSLTFQQRAIESRERISGIPAAVSILKLIHRYEQNRENEQAKFFQQRFWLIATAVLLPALAGTVFLLRRKQTVTRWNLSRLFFTEQLLLEKKAQLQELQNRLHRLEALQAAEPEPPPARPAPAGMPGMHPLKEPVRYQSSPLTATRTAGYMSRLLHLMDRQKPHLESELTLQSLAILLHTNSSYLSRVLNETTGMNFRDFVNHYRVEEAKRLLAERKESAGDLLDICFTAGFNSAASFYRIFKKHTGMPPGQYLKQQAASSLRNSTGAGSDEK